jgi:hypothetical protein
MPPYSVNRSESLRALVELDDLARVPNEKREDESGDMDLEARSANTLLESVIAFSNLAEKKSGEDSAIRFELTQHESKIRDGIFKGYQALITKIEAEEDSEPSRDVLPINEYLIGGGLAVDAYCADNQRPDLKSSFQALVQAEQRRQELFDSRGSSAGRNVFHAKDSTVNGAVVTARQEFSRQLKAASHADSNRQKLMEKLTDTLAAFKVMSHEHSISDKAFNLIYGFGGISSRSPVPGLASAAFGVATSAFDLTIAALEVDQARARSEQISRFKQRIKEALISEVVLDQVDRSLVTRIADYCEQYRQDARVLADWDRVKGGVRIGNASTAMILCGVAAAVAVPGGSIAVAALGAACVAFDAVANLMVDARKNKVDQRQAREDLNAGLQLADQLAAKPDGGHGKVRDAGTLPDTTQRLLLDIGRKIRSGDSPLEKFLLLLGVPAKVLDAVRASKSKNMSKEVMELLRYSLFDANLNRPREADYEKIISDAAGKDVGKQRNALLTLREQLGPDKQDLMDRIQTKDGKKQIVETLLPGAQEGRAELKRADTWSYYLGKGSQCTDLQHANFSKTRFMGFWNKDEKFRAFVVRALGQTAQELGKDYAALAPDFDQVVRDSEHDPDDDVMALTAYRLYRHIRDSQKLCESWLSGGNFDDITRYSSGKFKVKNGKGQAGVTGTDIKRQAAAYLAREKMKATYKDFSKSLLEIYPVVDEIRKFTNRNTAIDARLMGKIISLLERNPGKEQEISRALVKHMVSFSDRSVSNWDILAMDFATCLWEQGLMTEIGIDDLKKIQLKAEAYETLRGYAGSPIGGELIFAFEKHPAFFNSKHVNITIENAKTILRERWIASRHIKPTEKFEQLMSLAAFTGKKKALSRWEGWGAWFKGVFKVKSFKEFISWFGSLFTSGLFSGAGSLAKLGPDGKHLKDLIEAELKGDSAPVEGWFREEFIAEALLADEVDVSNFMKHYLAKRNLPAPDGERTSVLAKLAAYRKFEDREHGARLLAEALCGTGNTEDGTLDAAREYADRKWLAYANSYFTLAETGAAMRWALEVLILMVKNRSLDIKPVVEIIEVILGRRNALTLFLPPDIDLPEQIKTAFNTSSIALSGLRGGNGQSIRDRAKRAVALLKEERLNPELVFDRLWIRDTNTVSNTLPAEADRTEWINRFKLYKDALRSGLYPKEHDEVVEWEIGAMLLGMKPAEAKRIKASEWAKGPRYLKQPPAKADSAAPEEQRVLQSLREGVLQSVRDYIQSNTDSPYWDAQDTGNKKLLALLNRMERWDVDTMSTSELRNALTDDSTIESAKLFIRMKLVQMDATIYSARRENDLLDRLAKKAGDKSVTDLEFEIAFSACRIELDRVRSEGAAEEDGVLA